MEEVTELIAAKALSKHEDAAQAIEEEVKVAVDALEMEDDALATRADLQSQKTDKEVELGEETTEKKQGYVIETQAEKAEKELRQRKGT